MHHMLALLALAVSAVASPYPQGVTSAIAPQASTPASCATSHDGSFAITAVNISTASKRDLERRQKSGTLTLTLSNSVLTDQAGRTGYIASNYQFQFDAPPQAGAIYTTGFSLCANGSLALGGSAIWWSCQSGSFSNFYDRDWAAHCVPIYLVALTGSSSAPPASESSEGQPVATSIAPASVQSDGQPVATATGGPVSVQSDGQPVATATGAPVSVQSDGQPVATATGAPVSVQSDGQPVATATGAPVSVQSDGQPVATATGAPVSVQSDGQPVATATGPPVSVQSDGQPVATATGAPVSVQSDGQPVATATGAPVSVQSDGQPVATATGAPVSVQSDGQPVATATGAPVSVQSDGQPVATATGAPVSVQSDGQPVATSVAPATFTGAAHRDGLSGGLAMVAGVAGAVMLL